MGERVIKKRNVPTVRAPIVVNRGTCKGRHPKRLPKCQCGQQGKNQGWGRGILKVKSGIRGGRKYTHHSCTDTGTQKRGGVVVAGLG